MAGAVRWFIHVMSRRVSGSHGKFGVAEKSERASGLSFLWDQKWDNYVPVTHFVRGDAQRWIRLHSLPASKQYAETDGERAEILKRHKMALADLLEPQGNHNVIVIGQDYDWNDSGAFSFRRLMPTSWPWRAVRPEVDGSTYYAWVVEKQLSDLDDLLIAIAEGDARAIITNLSLDWMYVPYDGGMDITLPSRRERDAIAARYADWLPKD